MVMTIPASALWRACVDARPTVSSRNFCVTIWDTESANSCKTQAPGCFDAKWFTLTFSPPSQSHVSMCGVRGHLPHSSRHCMHCPMALWLGKSQMLYWTDCGPWFQGRDRQLGPWVGACLCPRRTFAGKWPCPPPPHLSEERAPLCPAESLGDLHAWDTPFSLSAYFFF